MMAADAAIAAATLVLAALFALGVARVGHVYALMLVRALGVTFHWPAMQASTTLMVPERHLARVAGTSHALRGIANVSMPPLAALLLASVPLSAILAIDVATALACDHAARVRLRPAAEALAPAGRERVRAAVRLGRPPLRSPLREGLAGTGRADRPRLGPALLGGPRLRPDAGRRDPGSSHGA